MVKRDLTGAIIKCPSIKIPNILNLDLYKQFCLGTWENSNPTINQNKKRRDIIWKEIKF